MAISIFTGNKEGMFVTNENAARNRQDTRNAKGGKNIFAGNFNLQDNTIDLKRKLAQKRAAKVLSDAFAPEQEIDNDIEQLRQQQEQYKNEALENKTSIKELEEQRSQLMEDYNITEDSQEHMDLELLQKENKGEALTGEEKERLEILHENGLTDYQKDMLELDNREEVYRQRAEKSETASKAISGAITDIEIERLKTHPIADANKEADKILEQANKEMISSLYAEGKDHIDEMMEEAQEKAEKEAEEKEEEEKKEAEREKDKLELEKQIEQAKQNTAQAANAGTEDSTSASATVKADTNMDITDANHIINKDPANNFSESQTQKEIEKIIKELNLIMEDLKGSAVDLNV